jgi:hypothetical protein
MNCSYCSRFQNSKWRIQPDADEEGKKKFAPRLRHCNKIEKYIKGDREACDDLEPHHKFWCEKNNYWIAVEACLAKKTKGYDEDCGKCPQHKEIAELQRARKFHQRKLAELANEDTDTKPTLLLRRRA